MIAGILHLFREDVVGEGPHKAGVVRLCGQEGGVGGQLAEGFGSSRILWGLDTRHPRCVPCRVAATSDGGKVCCKDGYAHFFDANDVCALSAVQVAGPHGVWLGSVTGRAR